MYLSIVSYGMAATFSQMILAFRNILNANIQYWYNILTISNEEFPENVVHCGSELKPQKVKQLQLPCFQPHRQVSKHVGFITCNTL